MFLLPVLWVFLSEVGGVRVIPIEDGPPVGPLELVVRQPTEPVVPLAASPTTSLSPPDVEIQRTELGPSSCGQGKTLPPERQRNFVGLSDFQTYCESFLRFGRERPFFCRGTKYQILLYFFIANFLLAFTLLIYLIRGIWYNHCGGYRRAVQRMNDARRQELRMVGVRGKAADEGPTDGDPLLNFTLSGPASPPPPSSRMASSDADARVTEKSVLSKQSSDDASGPPPWSTF